MLPWFLPPGASQADLAAADTLASFLAAPSRQQRDELVLQLQAQYSSPEMPSLDLLRHSEVRATFARAARLRLCAAHTVAAAGLTVCGTHIS